MGDADNAELEKRDVPEELVHAAEVFLAAGKLYRELLNRHYQGMHALVHAEGKDGALVVYTVSPQWAPALKQVAR